MRDRKKYFERYRKSPEGRAVRRAWATSTYGKRTEMRHKMLQRYGLTWEQWNEMLIAQAGRCGLCGKPMMGKNDPAVDHDHVTGKVRGLLHVGCNAGLRCVEDEEFRNNAAAYLSQVI